LLRTEELVYGQSILKLQRLTVLLVPIAYKREIVSKGEAGEVLWEVRSEASFEVECMLAVLAVWYSNVTHALTPKFEQFSTETNKLI
jgi:hypothetical protein